MIKHGFKMDFLQHSIFENFSLKNHIQSFLYQIQLWKVFIAILFEFSTNLTMKNPQISFIFKPTKVP